MAENDLDVRYVAELARLELAPEQCEKLQRDLSAIVDYIAELRELDVTGVEPTAHALPLANVWREDVAGMPFARDAMLANAPATVNGETIKVPQVLPGEGMN
ncbi:MAG: Asp-tRNA(Asn)/Glu-tRNA(Gln) amidotransferase subunit GatC [Victivallaceae bacterium]